MYNDSKSVEIVMHLMVIQSQKAIITQCFVRLIIIFIYLFYLEKNQPQRLDILVLTILHYCSAAQKQSLCLLVKDDLNGDLGVFIIIFFLSLHIIVKYTFYYHSLQLWTQQALCLFVVDKGTQGSKNYFFLIRITLNLN